MRTQMGIHRVAQGRRRLVAHREAQRSLQDAEDEAPPPVRWGSLLIRPTIAYGRPGGGGNGVCRRQGKAGPCRGRRAGYALGKIRLWKHRNPTHHYLPIFPTVLEQVYTSINRPINAGDKRRRLDDLGVLVFYAELRKSLFVRAVKIFRFILSEFAHDCFRRLAALVQVIKDFLRP